MKTITERDGKNVNMQVVGDLHQYPDGSVHTVKEGKPVWEEGGGSGGSGGMPFVIEVEDDPTTHAVSTTVTAEELKANLYNCVIHFTTIGQMSYAPYIRPTGIYDLDIEGTRIVMLKAVIIDAEDKRRIQTTQIVVGTMEDGATVVAQAISYYYYAVPDYMKSGISMGDKLTVTGAGKIGWWNDNDQPKINS